MPSSRHRSRSHKHRNRRHQHRYRSTSSDRSHRNYYASSRKQRTSRFHSRSRSRSRSRHKEIHVHKYLLHLSSQRDKYGYQSRYRSKDKIYRRTNCSSPLSVTKPNVSVTKATVSATKATVSATKAKDDNHNNIDETTNNNKDSSSTKNDLPINAKNSSEKEPKKSNIATRQNKTWKEWEEKYIIDKRNYMINNCYKRIKKLNENDWKYIASQLELETKKRTNCEKGRSWKSVKSRFQTKISKNMKYFNNDKENVIVTNENNQNIRTKLKMIHSYRGTFIGEFQSFGDDKGKKNSTKKKQKYICLTNIRSGKNKNEILCDHVWLNVGKQIKDLGWLKRGKPIQFDGRIEKYRKGSIKRGIQVEYDYKITYPSKVKLYNASDNRNKKDDNNCTTDSPVDRTTKIENRINELRQILLKQKQMKEMQKQIKKDKTEHDKEKNNNIKPKLSNTHLKIAIINHNVCNNDNKATEEIQNKNINVEIDERNVTCNTSSILRPPIQRLPPLHILNAKTML